MNLVPINVQTEAKRSEGECCSGAKPLRWRPPDFRAFIFIPRIRADLRLVPKEGILESPDDPQVSTKNKPFSESTADKEVETSAPRRGIGGDP